MEINQGDGSTLGRQRAQQLAPYIEVSLRSTRDLAEYSHERIMQRWHVSADLNQEEPPDDDTAWTGVVDFHVGHIDLIKINIDSIHRALFVLDESDGSYFDLFSKLLHPESVNDLHPTLEDRLEPVGSWALLIKSVELTSQWRGAGIGKLLLEAALDTLLPDCRLVALEAGPLLKDREDTPAAPEWRAARTKIASNWRKLGFQNFKSNVMVLDPASTNFIKKTELLRKDYNLV